MTPRKIKRKSNKSTAPHDTPGEQHGDSDVTKSLPSLNQDGSFSLAVPNGTDIYVGFAATEPKKKKKPPKATDRCKSMDLDAPAFSENLEPKQELAQSNPAIDDVFMTEPTTATPVDDDVTHKKVKKEKKVK